MEWLRLLGTRLVICPADSPGIGGTGTPFRPSPEQRETLRRFTEAVRTDVDEVPEVQEFKRQYREQLQISREALQADAQRALEQLEQRLDRIERYVQRNNNISPDLLLGLRHDAMRVEILLLRAAGDTEGAEAAYQRFRASSARVLDDPESAGAAPPIDEAPSAQTDREPTPDEMSARLQATVPEGLEGLQVGLAQAEGPYALEVAEVLSQRVADLSREDLRSPELIPILQDLYAASERSGLFTPAFRLLATRSLEANRPSSEPSPDDLRRLGTLYRSTGDPILRGETLEVLDTALDRLGTPVPCTPDHLAVLLELANDPDPALADRGRRGVNLAFADFERQIGELQRSVGGTTAIQNLVARVGEVARGNTDPAVVEKVCHLENQAWIAEVSAQFGPMLTDPNYDFGRLEQQNLLLEVLEGIRGHLAELERRQAGSPNDTTLNPFGSQLEVLERKLLRQQQQSSRVERGPLQMDSPAVRAFLGSIPETASSPRLNRAEVAARLQGINDRGQLTGELLDQLSALRDPNRTPLPPDMARHRDRIFSETLGDLADPTTINQGSYDSCGGTRVQALLAMQDPARYVQILRELASPEGRSPGPPPLQRPGSVSPRSMTGTKEVMIPAFTEYAGVPWVQRGGRFDAGLDRQQQERLLEGVLGMSFQLQDCAGIMAPATNRVFENANCAASEGHVVPVTLRWGGYLGNHAVLFLGVTRDENGQEYAMFANPQGGTREHMPLAEFKSRLREAYIPEGTPVPPYRPTDWENLSRSTERTEFTSEQ